MTAPRRLAMLTERRVHAVLPTLDVDGLRSFYEGVLGFTPRAVRSGAVLYDAGEGSVFAVSRTGAPSSSTHTQLAFTVADIEAEVADLQGRGIVLEEYEMPKTTNGVATVPAGKAAWFKDPHGNILGLIQFDDPT
jgi:predicted enzyme related to lactoylglutathione lyase